MARRRGRASITPIPSAHDTSLLPTTVHLPLIEGKFSINKDLRDIPDDDGGNNDHGDDHDNDDHGDDHDDGGGNDDHGDDGNDEHGDNVMFNASRRLSRNKILPQKSILSLSNDQFSLLVIQHYLETIFTTITQSKAPNRY